MKYKQKALIIPRNDGIALSLDGNLTIVEMDAEQMLEMAHRCQQVGLEMLRLERRVVSSGHKAASHD